MAYFRVVIQKPTGSAGGGEANTTSNSGTGEGLALPKAGVNLPFKTIKATGDATVSSDGDSVTIDVTSGGGNTLNQLLQTGIFKGGLVTVNGGDNTLVDISAGNGQIVDFSDPNIPIVTPVSWGQMLGVSMPDIGGSTFSRLYFDESGTLIKQASQVFTSELRRTKIAICLVVHASGVIESITYTAAMLYNPIHAMMDYFNANGGVVNGSEITTPNTDLTFSQNAGTFTIPFINEANALNPSTLSNTGVDPKDFNYSYRDGIGGFVTVNANTLIDPVQYDDGSGTLQPVGGPNPDWTWQPVYYFGEFNRLVIYYGQFRYNTKELAVRGVSEDLEEMITNPLVSQNAKLLGFFVLDESTTDLTDSNEAEFISVQGLALGGGALGSTTYDGLTDTPSSKAGEALKFPRVNAGETAHEYHTIVKADVGLGNADNTSDANKPVSTATQTALDLKVSSTIAGEPTGSDRVLNTVSLTQAEYDAGTPIATTFYIITDA
jgi:hypothetical protein